MTPERRRFDPDSNPADQKKPFDTGVYITTAVDKLLQPRDSYAVDYMYGHCTTDNSLAAYVLILNWDGATALGSNGVKVC